MDITICTGLYYSFLVLIYDIKICNSTNAIVTSGGAHFLFSNNGDILVIMELSNQDEKGIWNLFS